MDKKTEAAKLRNQHSDWRDKNFSEKEGFFPVFSGFKKHLNTLSGGAVSLFIYLGLNSNNQTGECYHGIERIAEYFGKSPRTVSAWFRELEEVGLVERLQLQMNGVAHTFIRPYKIEDGGKFEKNKDV